MEAGSISRYELSKQLKQNFLTSKRIFTTEFESTLVIVLKQLFLEGSVNIVEYVVD